MAGAGRTKLSQLLRTRAASFLPTASRRYSAAGQDDVVKQAFVTQQTKFRAFLGELAKVKITLDSDDQKAVKEYATTMKSIRTKLAIPSYTEKIADLLESAGDDAADVRSYLKLKLAYARSEVGIQDDLGADKLTLQALDKVEKSLGKPLLLDDKQGLTLLSKEIDEINKKLGLDEALLEKLEEEVEMAVAKGELEEITKEAREKIETYKRRDELDTLVVEPKELDYRQYL